MSDVVPPSPILTQPEAAEALAHRLAGASVIAVDTEGDGMFRYRARLCVVQLASEDELAVVDTLAVDVRVFGLLLGERGPEKVLHDAAFDVRMLAAHGVMLGRVFDTAVAARFAGFPATGLASLLSSLFGVDLPKQHQHADWGERPLDAEAIAYLENDVRYLLALRGLLLERLRALDIEEEFREECAHLTREGLKPPAEGSPLARLKGALARPPKQRARLYELALVRDELARERDVPPARLVSSEQLLRIAERPPSTEHELAARLGDRGELAEPLYAALRRSDARRDAPQEALGEPLLAPSGSEIALRRRRRELLTSFRAREAAVRKLDPQVILPGHCVSDLIKLPTLDPAALASVSGLGACRIDRYARRWRDEFGRAWSGRA